jgi:hypothetical protein
MYANAIDDDSCALLGVFSGPGISTEQYELSLSEMHRADLLAAARGVPFVYVAIVENDVQRPPAVWRKRFSDANHSVRCERFYFVMVTSSMLMRGVFTAVNWITPARAGQHYGVVASVPEAQRWLAREGANPPDLLLLEARARSAHEAASKSRASGGR